jgi:hypothetical protein
MWPRILAHHHDTYGAVKVKFRIFLTYVSDCEARQLYTQIALQCGESRLGGPQHDQVVLKKSMSLWKIWTSAIQLTARSCWPVGCIHLKWGNQGRPLGHFAELHLVLHRCHYQDGWMHCHVVVYIRVYYTRKCLSVNVIPVALTHPTVVTKLLDLSPYSSKRLTGPDCSQHGELCVLAGTLWEVGSSRRSA